MKSLITLKSRRLFTTRWGVAHELIVTYYNELSYERDEKNNNDKIISLQLTYCNLCHVSLLGDYSPRGGVSSIETIIYYLFIVAYLFTYKNYSPRGGMLRIERIIYYLFIVAYLFTVVTYKNYSPRGGVLLTYGTCLHRL